MKQYTFTVTVTEGNDEFWEGLLDKKSSGCDDLTEAVSQSLWSGDSTAGMDIDIKLTKFTD